MVCVQCGSKTHVVNSRPQKRLNQIWRRRECTRCGTVFTTEETVQYGGAWAVRGQTGSLQPFSRDQLFLSLYRSLEHRKTALTDASGLANTVIRKLAGNARDGLIEARLIEHAAQVALNRFDKAASVHYRAFHQR